MEQVIDYLLDLIMKQRLTYTDAIDAGTFTAKQIKHLDHTVLLMKNSKEVYFYSSLPEDEADFWKGSIIQDMIVKQKPDIKSIKIEFPVISGYSGLWIAEAGSDVDLSDDEYKMIRLTVLFILCCLFRAEAKESRRSHPLTGLPGYDAFINDMESQVRNKVEGYLVAVKSMEIYSDDPLYAPGKRNEKIRALASLCKEGNPDKVYHIFDDIFILHWSGSQENAIAGLQAVMVCGKNLAFVLAPVSYLEKEDSITGFFQALVKTECGAVSKIDNTTAELLKAENSEEQNG